MRIRAGVSILLAAISAAALSGEPLPEDGAHLDEMGIHLGQLAALLTRATEATYKLTSRDSVDCATRSLDIGIKETAVELSLFVRLLQDVRVAGTKTPKQLKLPAWVFESPGCPTLEEIERRSDWLEEQLTAATEPVCAKAAEKTGDSLICSVE
jgi:hypothetical protein